MAITLSNSGITSGSIIKSSEVSQSIDAFAGLVAYDIHQSGSFNQTGSTVLSGSVYLPDNTHIGIGTTPSATAGVKLSLKANDSSNDPTILLDAFGAADSATIGWKNPDVRWNLGLSGGSADAFTLQNQTTNKFPILVDYSSSNSTIVLRNDNGSDIFQKVGINWPYGGMPITNPNHTLLVSGSVTSSVGYYGRLFGVADSSSKVYVADMIGNQTMPLLVKAGGLSTQNDYNTTFASPDALNWNNLTFMLETTASWASHSISSSYSETASYAITAESANPLWYDGSTYISSSLIISGSTFKGNDADFKRSVATTYFSSSLYMGGNFTGSSFTASNATEAVTIGPNDFRFNKNQASYINNINTGNSATLNLGVGGVGGATTTGLIINNHNELSIGSSTPAFSYPLGYTAGEIHSYIQMQYNHQNSASVLALKGASGGDGIVYLGGNEEYGGGQLFHGGNSTQTKIPSTFQNGNTSLYRVSKSVASPILDYPTDNNHIRVVLDNNPIDDGDLDYFGVGPVGSIKPYRRTYMLQGILTTGAGNTVSLGEVGAFQEGTYMVRLTVGKSDNISTISVASVTEMTSTYYVDSFGAMPTAFTAGTLPTTDNIEGMVGSANVNISIVTISSPKPSFQFRANGSVAKNMNISGFAEITFFPNTVA